MNVKILFAYMEKCEKLGVEPTWEGLKFYRYTGIINNEPKPFEVPKREIKIFAPVENKLNTKVMADYCAMCEKYGVEPTWDDAIALNNMLFPPKAVAI